MVASMRVPAVALLAGLAFTGPAAAEPMTVEPEDSGFAVSVIGAKEGMDPDAFARTVVGYLPPELLDGTRNFTSDELFDRQRNYRIVIAFHDAEVPVTPDLCRPDAEALQMAEQANPDYEGLASALGVAAALCEGEQALSTSTNRSVGRVQPEDLSFGFLVSDTVKDLFPDGFAALPRGRGDTERAFGSTVGPATPN